MKNSKHYLLFVLITFLCFAAYAQQNPPIMLWSNGAPGANPNGGEETVRIYEPTGDHVISNIHSPSIIPFIPAKDKSTGVAIIIAPGGGHRELWIDHEGYNAANLLSENGIAAFVLKYRLAKQENSTYTVDKDEVNDMLRAIRFVRSHSVEWNIDPNKIGIIGFSAGGEVAGLADMNADDGSADAKDSIDTFSSKPNFQALIYPGGTNRIIPTDQSSPAFLVCGYHDRDDISKGIADLYLKFKELNIPAELHIYANAGHGFGIRKGDKGASSKWIDAFIAWINDVTSNAVK